jgi:uncharacterized LabA/DUF88 family protein
MESEYDTIVLFSGDSDFEYLAKILHAKKKHIVIISSKHHISRELVQGCDKYIDLKKIRFAIERIEKRQSPPFSAGS